MYIAEELWILVEVLASSSLPGRAVTLRCSSSKKNGYIDTRTRRFPGCGRVEPVMTGYFEHTYDFDIKFDASFLGGFVVCSVESCYMYFQTYPTTRQVS